MLSNENVLKFTFGIEKTKVAPTRHFSISGLELQVAVMALRLKQQTFNEHEMKDK